MRTTPVHRGRPATAGLALAALATAGLALTAGPAFAGTTPHNEQVVLANGTDAQADAKSAISGTGQVASYDGRFVVFSTAARLVRQDRNDLDDVYLRDTVDDITDPGQPEGQHDRQRLQHRADDLERRPVRRVHHVRHEPVRRTTNGGVLDVAVKDMFTGKIRLASVGRHGGSGSRTASRRSSPATASGSPSRRSPRSAPRTPTSARTSTCATCRTTGRGRCRSRRRART